MRLLCISALISSRKKGDSKNKVLPCDTKQEMMLSKCVASQMGRKHIYIHLSKPRARPFLFIYKCSFLLYIFLSLAIFSTVLLQLIATMIRSDSALSVRDARGRQISLLCDTVPTTPSSKATTTAAAGRRRYHCTEPGCNKSFTTRYFSFDTNDIDNNNNNVF